MIVRGVDSGVILSSSNRRSRIGFLTESFALSRPRHTSGLLSRNVDGQPNLLRNVLVASSILEEAMGSKQFKGFERHEERHAEPDSPKRRMKGKLFGIQSVVVHVNSKAGSSAANLTNLLRERNMAELQFSNCRGILKALKVLAIAHDFLGQHGSTLSFSPSGYEVTKVYSEVDSSSRPTHRDLDSKDYSDGNGKDVPASSKGWHTEQFFTLKVWRRTLRHKEIEVELRPAYGGPPLYDFSLDARREWKSKAAVSEDLSYSLADMLYGLLVDRPEGTSSQAGSINTHLPDRGSAPEAADEAPEVSVPSLNPSITEFSGPVLLSGDMAQSPTLFMALTLLQQRLRAEDMSLNVMCTVYRNTIAPRLDGRNGFVFKVWTRFKDNRAE